MVVREQDMKRQLGILSALGTLLLGGVAHAQFVTTKPCKLRIVVSDEPRSLHFG